MASSHALKPFISSTFLSRSLRPVTLPAASSRFFNTNAVPAYDSDDDDHRPDPRVFCPYYRSVRGPFPTKSSPTIQTPSSPPVDSGIRHDWKAKQTADGLHLRLYMPGLGKEDVKVWVEQSEMIAEGMVKKEFEDDIDTLLRYRINLPEKLVKTNEIKAEMKNGVMKVFVPKIKEEERTDVIRVNVE